MEQLRADRTPQKKLFSPIEYAGLQGVVRKAPRPEKLDVDPGDCREKTRLSLGLCDVMGTVYDVEKLARITPEEANRRLSLIPPAGCRNSFSSCNDGKATRDDLHRKDWHGSSLRAGPAATPPYLSPPSGGGTQLDAGLGVTVEC